MTVMDWRMYADTHRYGGVESREELIGAVFHSLNDDGNGKRLVRLHGEDIRYVSEDRGWNVWDGSRWSEDLLNHVQELAKKTATSIYAEAATWAGADDVDVDLRNAISRHAHRSHNMAGLVNMVRAAESDPAVVASKRWFDTDIWALNCTNGTVDLRTGTLRPARRQDLISKTTGIAFDPDAKCPRWEAFIMWAMLDRVELVTYVQRALGMSLCGNVSERIVLFLHGSGDNGKTLTLKTTSYMAGDYGQRMSSKTLEAAKYASGGGGPSEDIAVLKGARFVYASEIEEGVKLATALLKDLTGDEGALRARHLYKGSFEFVPEFTPWIGANHKMIIPSDDQAIWNRLRLVPFDAVIADEDKDKFLFDKFKAEAQGVLAWHVHGCVEWHEHGLNDPPAVMEATAQYRNDMDTFGEFLEYIESYQGAQLAPRSLRTAYNIWAEDAENAMPMSQRIFKAHMQARGWGQGKDDDGRRWVRPAVKVTRTNWGELARLSALHELTAEEIAAEQAELDAIAAEEWARAEAGGYPSVGAMYEDERLKREAEAE